MTRFRLTGWLAAAAVIFALLAGCGGDEPVEALECGENTALQDGVCVLEEHDCEQGQVVSPMGVCEDPDVFCFDEGTTYDTELGECVSNEEIVCGEATVEQDGTCVADGPTSCADGTALVDGSCVLAESYCGDATEYTDGACSVTDAACINGAQFDAGAGECVFYDIVECGENTVESDGACVPLRTYADELAADADIDHSDDEPIVPTEEHNPFIFTGALDDTLSQTFDLEADEGQWLEITLYSRGLPAPGFRVEHDFDDWRRATVPGLSNQPSRTVFIPRDGTYELTVETSISDDDGFSTGDEEWEYVGAVEILQSPEPNTWNFQDEALIGDLSNTTENLVELDVEGRDEVLLTARALGSDAEDTTVEVWESPTNFSTRHRLGLDDRVSLDTSGVDETFIHVDSAQFLGSDTGYELEGQGAVTLESGEIYDETVDAEAGEVIFIAHRSDQALPTTVRVFLDDEFQRRYTDALAHNEDEYETAQTKRQYFFVPEDGEYRLSFQNVNDQELTNFISLSEVGDVPLYEINPPDATAFDGLLEGEDMMEGDWRIVEVDATTAAVIEGEADETNDASWPPDVALYDLEEGQELARSSGSYNSPNDFQFVLPDAGRFLVAAQPTRSYSSAALDDIEIEMDATAVQMVDPGETKVFSFDADTNDVLSGKITYMQGPAPDVRLVNPHGATIFGLSGIDSGFDLMELFPGPGQFDLEVHNGGDEPILGLDVDATITSPFDEVDVEQDFSNTYQRPALDSGDRDFLLYRPGTDTQINFSAIFEEGEEGVVQIWDVEAREILQKVQAEQRIDFEDVGLTQGVYAFEFRASTDIGDYDVIFGGSNIDFVDDVRSHDPVLEIATDGGYETSALSVDECAQVEDVSISVDMPSADNNDTNVYLYAPGLNDPITLRDGTWGSHTTVYPDETSPAESLDPIRGTNGGGVWSLDIENESSSTTAELAAWGVHLRCLK